MRLVFVTAALVFLARSLPADTSSIAPASIALPFVHDFAWDATRSRIWVSSGTSIVLVNPETANVDETLVSGLVAGKIALSGDGQYLYASVGSRASIQRYRLDTHALDLEFFLGVDSQGRNLSAAAIAVLPG